MAREDASALARALSARDPAVGLEAVWALRQLIDRAERVHVDTARIAGWSWQQLADALHVSRQSAHEKHAQRRKMMGLEA